MQHRVDSHRKSATHTHDSPAEHFSLLMCLVQSELSQNITSQLQVLLPDCTAMIEPAFVTQPLCIGAPVIDGLFALSNKQHPETFAYDDADVLVATGAISHTEFTTLVNGGQQQQAAYDSDESGRIFGSDMSFANVDHGMVQQLMKKIDRACLRLYLSIFDATM